MVDQMKGIPVCAVCDRLHGTDEFCPTRVAQILLNLQVSPYFYTDSRFTQADRDAARQFLRRIGIRRLLEDYLADQFEVDHLAEQNTGGCCICGAELESGWMCLDGGDEVCSEHIDIVNIAEMNTCVGTIVLWFLEGNCTNKVDYQIIKGGWAGWFICKSCQANVKYPTDYLKEISNEQA
ncbi:MAG: hypothetical protein AABY07_10270 [Nanoarchaeota archaeon]